SAAQTSIGKLLHSYPAAQLLAHGATVALVGSPNVGKSTLMNLLLGSERSIVTDIPGTTRDVVEGTLEAGGATLRLLDTAGIRDTTDVIERIGVARARNALETADLILLVLDRSHCPNQSDAALLASVMERPHVVALNKTDLPPHPGWEAFAPYVEISAATGEGGSALRMAIDESLGLSGAAQAGLAANERQYDCLVRSNEALVMAMDALMEGVTLDAVGIVLDDAIAPLCELTGRTASETVLGQVFSKFCVGK
ncbi:MAG: GTPase, partial [Oscillospiraceae bacterium]